MRIVYADLHIHTCLSPCAEKEMTPVVVVRAAKERRLDVIAICDHNSAENVAAVRKAARTVGLAVIGGMEITSREEVHVLGLFAEDRALAAAQRVVWEHLPGQNDPDAFGEQLIVDEQDKVIGRNQRLLIGATELALEEVVGTIHTFGGIAIAAHVDRPSFSVVSQLGFIPDDLGLDGVEICSWSESVVGRLPVIFSSDAHRPKEIGTPCTRFFIEAPTVPEIEMTLRQLDGRRILT